ncbi:MAG: RNA-binding protein [Chitinophagaceae bacterium]|nr:RNA-binding protein [Chitinophagaceae bacterium]
MFKLGEVNHLTVLRETRIGLYLGDDEGNDILLPVKYVNKPYMVGQTIPVFVYKDNEGRWICTTLRPYIKVNQFAYLKIRSVSSFGAFAEWGIEKDLLVPFREQNRKMVEGQRYVLYLYEDQDTGRLVASNKIHRFLNNEDMSLSINDEVDLLVFETTPLGYNVIVNHQHKGLLYHSDLFQQVRIGDRMKGYVKQIREDLGLDISPVPLGMQRLEEGAEEILEYLQLHKGFVALTDKSSPEAIQRIFDQSKKTFKRSVGILYKEKRIRLEPDGIYLI